MAMPRKHPACVCCSLHHGRCLCDLQSGAALAGIKHEHVWTNTTDVTHQHEQPATRGALGRTGPALGLAVYRRADGSLFYNDDGIPPPECLWKPQVDAIRWTSYAWVVPRSAKTNDAQDDSKRPDDAFSGTSDAFQQLTRAPLVAHERVYDISDLDFSQACRIDDPSRPLSVPSVAAGVRSAKRPALVPSKTMTTRCQRAGHQARSLSRLLTKYVCMLEPAGCPKYNTSIARRGSSSIRTKWALSRDAACSGVQRQGYSHGAHVWANNILAIVPTCDDHNSRRATPRVPGSGGAPNPSDCSGKGICERENNKAQRPTTCRVHCTMCRGDEGGPRTVA